MWSIGDDGRLHDRYWDGTEWHHWADLGSPTGVRLAGQPAAAARDAGRIDVFAPGDDGRLWHRRWDGSAWVPWEPVAGAPAGVTAVAASWVGGRLDVYARGADRSLWYLALITAA